MMKTSCLVLVGSVLLVGCPFPSNTQNQTTPGGQVSGDPNWANVVVLMHMDGAGSTFTETKQNLTVTNGHSVTQVTGATGFGNAAQFSSSQYGLSLADSNDWTIGTGAYTVEARVYLNTLPPTGNAVGLVTSQKAGYDTNWDLSYSNDGTNSYLEFYFTYTNAGTVVNQKLTSTALAGLTTGTWHNVAVTYDGSTVRLFFDGTACGSASAASGIGDDVSSLPLFVGSDNPAGWYLRNVDGMIDELRITKGVCRYQANYTPATAPFPDN